MAKLFCNRTYAKFAPMKRAEVGYLWL